MAPSLMSVPIELRHRIFELVAEHPDGAQFVLKEYFERADNNCAGVSANEEIQDPYDAVENNVEDEDNGSEDDGVDNDDNDEDGEDDVDGEDDGEVVGEDEENDTSIGGNQVPGFGHAIPGSFPTTTATQVPSTTTTPTSAAPQTDVVGDGWSTTPQDNIVPRTVHPATKYRYTVPMINLSSSPPPVNLLLTCKQLRNEVLSWYYDMATLNIDVTKSFMHQSLFEETLELLQQSNSNLPISQLRRAKITFVWDSLYMRAQTYEHQQLFHMYMAILRRDWVVRVLREMPFLQELKVVWHDTVKDAESMQLQMEALSEFIFAASEVNAEYSLKEHYPTAGEVITETSLLGKKRRELTDIVRTGAVFR